MCTNGGSVAGVTAVLAEVNAVDVAALADVQVRDELLELLAARNSLDAAIAARLASFDGRELSDLDGLRATRTWLTGFGRLSQGAVSGEHVDKVHQLAHRVGLEAVRDYDEILAGVSSTAGPGQTLRAAERIAAHLDPDGQPPDPEEDFARRELTLARTGSMTYLRGRLDAEAAAVVHTVLDALMRPPTAEDTRSAPQRRVDALIDLFKGFLAGGGLPTVGGERPQIGILVSPLTLAGLTPTSPAPAGGGGSAGDASAADRWGGDGLLGGDGLAPAGIPAEPDRPWLSWVGAVSTVPRRLLRRWPGHGAGLVWTEERSDEGAQRRRSAATKERSDEGRRGHHWPHGPRERSERQRLSDAPAQWVDIHHLDPWIEGGLTNVDRLLSVCRYHHVKVHEGHWSIEFHTTTGEVTVTRPDGTPYELGPSQPWTTPTRQRPTQHGDPDPPAKAA